MPGDDIIYTSIQARTSEVCYPAAVYCCILPAAVGAIIASSNLNTSVPISRLQLHRLPFYLLFFESNCFLFYNYIFSNLLVLYTKSRSRCLQITLYLMRINFIFLFFRKSDTFRFSAFSLLTISCPNFCTCPEFISFT